jgi:SAM-dependent methyltransferase
MQLRSVSAPAPCKACGAATSAWGAVDFSRSSQMQGGPPDPPIGVPVHYRRCGDCGLIFTDAFDDWSQSDFLANIYNDGYLAIDPDYAEARPAGSARQIVRLFGRHTSQLSVLDYGTGTGVLVERLRRLGVGQVTGYDPFNPEFAVRPTGTFNLVTCFETLEHLPDPAATLADLAGFVAPDGVVLFSTLLQPPDIESQGVGWWYIGPRNGHVTLYSWEALNRLWGRLGFTVGSFNENLHIAYRELPSFAAHLLG